MECSGQVLAMNEEGKPWDFDIPSQRRKAELIRLLVGSLLCSAFCVSECQWSKEDRRGKAKDPNQSPNTPSVHDEFVQDADRVKALLTSRAPGIREQLGRGQHSENHGHERRGNCVCAPNSDQEAGRVDWEPTEEVY